MKLYVILFLRSDLMNDMLMWTFIAECPIPKDVEDLLVNNEKAVAAYKTVRDTAIFTNKRIIIKDVQGITGKKVEIYSIPFSSIIMWSTENAGIVDFNSEVEVWTKIGKFKINLSKGVNVRQFDKLMAFNVLKD